MTLNKNLQNFKLTVSLAFKFLSLSCPAPLFISMPTKNTKIKKKKMLVNSKHFSVQHFTSQREDFEGTREGILVWLTEMDLQLTNVEHFSESDIHEKMRQLNVCTLLSYLKHF